MAAESGRQRAERRLHTFPAFSYLPVVGSYRAPEDAFQLWPAPAEAPRPPAQMGDHPFLLQYEVPSGGDRTDGDDRSIARRFEWIWFLNAVLKGHYNLQPVRGRQMWAFIQPEGVDWVSEGYVIKGFRFPSGPDYAHTDAEPVEVVDADQYYAARGISLEQTFTIPGTFSDDVRRYLELEPALRERFLRAAQWVATAHELWQLHFSSWFIALVAAIENLVDHSEPDRCPTCGQERHHATTRFREVVERYAPTEANRGEAEELYSVRSGLVHGRAMLQLDAPPSFDRSTFAIEELDVVDRLSRVVRLVMVHWLRDPI